MTLGGGLGEGGAGAHRAGADRRGVPNVASAVHPQALSLLPAATPPPFPQSPRPYLPQRLLPQEHRQEQRRSFPGGVHVRVQLSGVRRSFVVFGGARVENG